MVRGSDLVLCMEPGHVARAQELAPNAVDRIRLITRTDAEPAHSADAGVSDPIGGVASEYEDAFNRIGSFCYFGFLAGSAGRATPHGSYFSFGSGILSSAAL